MLSTGSTFYGVDQQAKSNLSEIQELIQKAQYRIGYFIDIDHDILQEWVRKYNECLHQINESKQMNCEIKRILQNLISTIEIIETEGMLLVGNFKPWMSGVGMIKFPYGYTLYGKIQFGILNGQGMIEIYKKNTRLIGTFSQNKLQGNGTIIVRNQYQINGIFQKGKIISGPISIKYLNGSENQVQAELKINGDQIRLGDQEQLRNNISLSNLEFNRPNNVQYKASQFLLGQNKQSSFALYQNDELQLEYRDGKLIYGVGQNHEPNNILLIGKFNQGALFGLGKLIDYNNLFLLEGEFQNSIIIHGKKYHLESNILYEDGQFNKQVQLSGNGKRYFEIAEKKKVCLRMDNQMGKVSDTIILMVKQENVSDFQQNQIMEEGSFNNGILIKGTKFYQNGLIQEKGEFNQNGLINEGERRHPNGYIQEYGIFLDGQLHSKDDMSGRANDNGVIIEVGYFQKGQLNGEGERRHPSGRKKEVGNFSLGLLDGSGKRYYDNEENTLEEEGVFQDGQLHSLTTISKQYYQDGSLKCFGLLQNGLLTTIDGLLYFNEYEMKGVFQNGQVNGTMRILNSKTQMEFRDHHFQSNETFLRAANKANVYLGSQFHTKAQSSYKRL
ncbi:unnamed protein product (macronuclear) [Paramecium tetraurelia]|uniref:MORN repeat protein n=1 Tax=Paramecium tetraurelia TaxID=5888 RepID=A0BSD2_PARTE|nr:uncharacterized protein GSPATT00031680001 [Paramecium tetraurelia]CAK61449.1 unnamed protein product [Paramecium tetraurelia]|eukprot:XP_001428847.1 hypothetical protein (macronuclear) [Paramecium tetraurelia strain d4-2]